MTDPTTLLALAERVEKATGHTRGIDGDVALAFGLVPKWAPKQHPRQPELFSDSGPGLHARTWSAPKFTSSLDAAMTLAKGLERSAFDLLTEAMERFAYRSMERLEPHQDREGLARFFIAACLRARAAQVQS